MRNLKWLFDLYINSSIHVAFSCFALVQISQIILRISNDNLVSNFVFFGTIVGYNFVKYQELVRVRKVQMKWQLRLIALFSFYCLMLVGNCFFELERSAQIAAFVFLGLTLLYALPVFSNKKNARNFAGVKIYIVSFCWVGATVFLPFFNAGIVFDVNFYVVTFQRFILIFVLILIFEIIDLKHDDPNLRTVPQQIGVKYTKMLGCFLLVVFCVLSLFSYNNPVLSLSFTFEIMIANVTALFLVFANENRSKYYTSFWVESIPIVWWVLLLLFR
jgi:hypothetical protein